ncbi:MAG: hypothetical protein WC640_01380 [Candidatus Paceibacterota bacterium]|jgi:hypothetical protein
MFESIFWTIISGVAVFVVSQLVLELCIKPYREYRDIKYRISNKLKYYSNLITNPLNLLEPVENLFTTVTKTRQDDLQEINRKEVLDYYLKTSSEMRKLSCDLETGYFNNLDLIRKIFIKEDLQDIDKASSLLIRISNCLFEPRMALQNGKDIDEIKKHLNLKSINN